MAFNCIKCLNAVLHPFHDDGTINAWWDVDIPLEEDFDDFEEPDDEPVLANVMVRYEPETDRMLIATTRFVVVPVARELWEDEDNDGWLRQVIADGFNQNRVEAEDIVLRDE